MIRTFTAAVFALLIATAPARAALVWEEIDTIDLTYPNNTTLTGELNIRDAAPFVVGAYVPEESSSLRLNGNPLTFVTSGTGFPFESLFQNCCASITFFVPPPNSPGTPTPYGEVLLGLTVPNIFLNGVPPTGGTITTQFCVDNSCGAISAVPLPAALPLFASALAGLGGVGWLKKRGKVSRKPTAR
jgi:hypothetical protein